MNFKKISALACAMTIMGGLAQAVPAYATNLIPSGETKVSYDNREVLPDGNGEYGMIIPTAISFTDEEMTGNANIEITGINGYELSDWETLTVKASVQSENQLKLSLNGTEHDKYATYGLKYGTDMFEQETHGSSKNDITERLGIGNSGQKAVVEGTANLKDKSKATVKGQYKDVLTYSFEEEANKKK